MNGSENKRIIVLGFTGAGTALGRELCGKLKKTDMTVRVMRRENMQEKMSCRFRRTGLN